MPDPTILQLFNKRITGWLNWKLNRKGEIGDKALTQLVDDIKKQPHDHLAITGDLVNLALPIEFQNARDWLEQLGRPQDISVVFGNHDAYVPGALKTAITTFAPWLTSDIAVSTPFPYMRIRKDIAIIGCSSAIATMPFRATGTFGKKQAEELARLLQIAQEKQLFKVVMIHHPPVHHATHRQKILTDIDCFQSVIAEFGADLILHGHTHLPTLYHIKGKGRGVPVVGVASASQSFGGKKPPANYNLFEIDKNNDQWQSKLSRFTIVNDNNDVECCEIINF